MFITINGLQLYRQMTRKYTPSTLQNLQGTPDNYLVLSSIGFNKVSVSTLIVGTVVGQNPPASSDRQHEEPRGSRDCWWAPVPRSTAQNPAHVLACELLGVPPDLVPDQGGIIC
jgi:hypothetical protein